MLVYLFHLLFASLPPIPFLCLSCPLHPLPSLFPSLPSPLLLSSVSLSVSLKCPSYIPPSLSSLPPHSFPWSPLQTLPLPLSFLTFLSSSILCLPFPSFEMSPFLLPCLLFSLLSSSLTNILSQGPISLPLSLSLLSQVYPRTLIFGFENVT